MAFEIPRISSSTVPPHTLEASTLPPSARPLAQPDTLASYTKAAQHGDGCCVTLLGGIWKCASFLLGGIWKCVTGCLGMFSGKGGERSISTIIRERGLEEKSKFTGGILPSDEGFNEQIHEMGPLHQYLYGYDMERGKFPKLTTGFGLLNCIRAVYECKNGAEIMPLLVDHVINKIRNKGTPADILKLGISTMNEMDSYARQLDAFVCCFISKLLEEEKMDADLLEQLFAHQKFICTQIVATNPVFLNKLTTNQKNRFLNWLQTYDQSLCGKVKQKLGRTDDI
jgi:hypothetical protein